MTFTKTFSAIALATTIFASASSSAFAGPVQSVSIAKEGIDAVMIEVTASGNQFNAIKSTSHKFGIKLYAKAVWGKKIVKAKVASGDAVIGEGDNYWSKTYNHSSRTFVKHTSPTIKMKDITFHGSTPVQACNAKLASHRNALTSGATAQVTAYFQLSATTKMYKNSPIAKNEKKAWMWYPIKVKCLPKSQNKGFTN